MAEPQTRTDHLSPADAAWFTARPGREFRCRHLTDAERSVPPYAHPGLGLAHVVYVRRSDGATVRALTPSPDLLIAEEGEGRARFAAQSMPNPPPLDEPIEYVETTPATPEAAALLQGQRAGTGSAEIQ